MKKRQTWLWGALGFGGFLALLLAYTFFERILLAAGGFLAPVNANMEGTADVVILEGTYNIKKEMVARAGFFLSTGKAKRLVIVLSRNIPDGGHPSLHMNDTSSINRTLEDNKIDRLACSMIVTHPLHPITLTSAREAMGILADEGVRSAILISPGFHMRRSYLVYQHIGIPMQIKIYPCASFDGHEYRWWTKRYGIYSFLEQVFKLSYYMVSGYIPVKFSYQVS